MKSACSRHTAPTFSYEFSSIYRKGCCSYRPANPHPSPLPAGEREQDRRARLQSKAPPRPPCRAKQRHPQAERSDGPCGARSRSPAPLRRRGAQRAADQGPRLFERSEFERDPADREHRRAVRAADRRSGVAFLWFLSLAKQRKGLARGGEIPASGLSSRSAATSSSAANQPGAALTPGRPPPRSPTHTPSRRTRPSPPWLRATGTSGAGRPHARGRSRCAARSPSPRRP